MDLLYKRPVAKMINQWNSNTIYQMSYNNINPTLMGFKVSLFIKIVIL